MLLATGPWSLAAHSLFPKEARQAVYTVMLASRRLESRHAALSGLVQAGAVDKVNANPLEQLQNEVGIEAIAPKVLRLAFLPPEIVLHTLGFIFRGDFGNLVQEAVFHIDGV